MLTNIPDFIICSPFPPNQVKTAFLPSLHPERVDSLVEIKSTQQSRPHNLLTCGEQVVGEKVVVGTSFSTKLSTTFVVYIEINTNLLLLKEQNLSYIRPFHSPTISSTDVPPFLVCAHPINSKQKINTIKASLILFLFIFPPLSLLE